MRYERTGEYRSPKHNELYEDRDDGCPLRFVDLPGCGLIQHPRWILREVPEPGELYSTLAAKVAARLDPPQPGSVIGAEYVGIKAECGQPHVVDGYALGVAGSSGPATEPNPAWNVCPTCDGAGGISAKLDPPEPVYRTAEELVDAMAGGGFHSTVSPVTRKRWLGIISRYRPAQSMYIVKDSLGRFMVGRWVNGDTRQWLTLHGWDSEMEMPFRYLNEDAAIRAAMDAEQKQAGKPNEKVIT